MVGVCSRVGGVLEGIGVFERVGVLERVTGWRGIEERVGGVRG